MYRNMGACNYDGERIVQNDEFCVVLDFLKCVVLFYFEKMELNECTVKILQLKNKVSTKKECGSRPDTVSVGADRGQVHKPSRLIFMQVII